MLGVTIQFFTASLRVLAEQYGDRAGWDKLEEVRRHLADAERAYREAAPLQGDPQKEKS